MNSNQREVLAAMAMRPSSKTRAAGIRAFGDFRDFWRDSPDYPEENRGNTSVQYPVQVLYEWAELSLKRRFTSVLRAYVGSGPEDGTIDLAESGKISVERFHLQFKPDFQVYSYNEDEGTLLIEGSSGKMRGRYRVTILPAMAEPE